ncbi:hypothetical protein D3C75_693890 [compost metagenome]
MLVQLQQCSDEDPLFQPKVVPLLFPSVPVFPQFTLQQNLQKLLPPDHLIFLLLFLENHIVGDQPLNGLINKSKFILAFLAVPRFH